MLWVIIGTRPTCAMGSADNTIIYSVSIYRWTVDLECYKLDGRLSNDFDLLFIDQVQQEWYWTGYILISVFVHTSQHRLGKVNTLILLSYH